MHTVPLPNLPRIVGYSHSHIFRTKAKVGLNEQYVKDERLTSEDDYLDHNIKTAS